MSTTTVAPTLAADRIFGVPASPTGKNDSLPSIADMLADLTRQHEELYVFHAMRLPNTDWTVDHVVLFRGLLFLVYDRYWADDAYYTLTEQLDVYGRASSYACVALQDDRRFADNVLKPRWGESLLRNYLPEYALRSIVTVHGENITAVNNFDKHKFLFITGNELEDQLRYMLASVGDVRPVPSAQAYVVTQLRKLVNLPAGTYGNQVPLPIRESASESFTRYDNVTPAPQDSVILAHARAQLASRRQQAAAATPPPVVEPVPVTPVQQRAAQPRRRLRNLFTRH